MKETEGGRVVRALGLLGGGGVRGLGGGAEGGRWGVRGGGRGRGGVECRIDFWEGGGVGWGWGGGGRTCWR